MATNTAGKSSEDDVDKPSSSSSQNENTESTNSTNYECNICLDTAKEAVISMCGHLFCWPCLSRWLETRPNRPSCPVCKAGISRDKVIPLYGRGSTNQTDPRNKTPPRPQGQRSEPENNGMFPGFDMGGGGGWHVSFGIGAFPFTFLSANLGGLGQAPPPGSPQEADERILSKLFLWVALAFLFWLLVA